jgi:hypothetical protein
MDRNYSLRSATQVARVILEAHSIFPISQSRGTA